MTAVLGRMVVSANTDWFVAQFMRRFLEAHVARGIRVLVMTPQGPHLGDLKAAGLDWAEMPMARGHGSPANSVRVLQALSAGRRAFKPDITHYVTLKPVLLGGSALMSTGYGSEVFVLPGLGHPFSVGGPLSWAERQLIRVGVRRLPHRRRAHIVFHQDSDRRRMMGGASPDGRSSVIPGWGIDLDRFNPGARERSGTPMVVMVSRMLRTKGVNEFVEAARICRKHIAVRFVLIGAPDPGNPASLSASALASLADSGEVEWWGHRTDIAEILREASVAVLPTRYAEGVPQFLIESAASGLPILASDVPGCREVVEHGGNGRLVPPGDVEMTAQSILDILGSSALRQEMSARGRRLAESRFSLAAILEAYSAVYDRLGFHMP